MRNSKISFTISMLILMTATFIPALSYSQDSIFIVDFPRIDNDFGIGIGSGVGFFDDDYYYPEQAFTFFRTVFGYIIDNRSWVGLGFNPEQTPDYDTEFTTLNYSNIYINTTQNLNLFYDYEEDETTSFLDVGYDLFLTFSFSMPYFNPFHTDRTFFDADGVIGDRNHIHNELSLYLKYMLRETRRLYRNSFTIYADISLKIGTEYSSELWLYLTSELRLDADLSVFGQYLFFELEGRSRIVSQSLNPNVPLPFFAYSKPNPVYPFLLIGTYDKRRDHFASTLRMDMKSHFYRSDENYTTYLYLRLVTGLGIFAQASLMGNSTANLDSLIDVGSYFEIVIEECVLEYDLVTQIGVDFGLYRDEMGEIDYKPKFYLRISI
jgi:hypothetical protein